MTKPKSPAPEEPSVLDYVKARLKFWQVGGKIELPAEPSKREAGKPAARPQSMSAQTSPARVSPLRGLPWRSILALVFALLGQIAFEPTKTRSLALGLVLYAISLAWLVLAILRQEWTGSPLREAGRGSDTLRIHPLPLALAAVFGVAAFVNLGGNLFTPVNVTLWVLSILFIVLAFWLPGPHAQPDQGAALEGGPLVSGNVLANDLLVGAPATVTAARQGNKKITIGAAFPTSRGGSLTLLADGSYTYAPPQHDLVPPEGLKETFRYTLTDKKGGASSSTLMIKVSDSDFVLAPRPFWTRWKDFLSRPSWQVNITRWTLLVLVVVALVVFFRAYNLNGVPAEPFSDHAEKILDVYDITQGETHIFFTRNTGREGLQMYLTVVVAWLFKTGLSFLSLKIGTVICGLLTLPYMYLLGREIGGKRLGLLALLFTGIGYWPNVISRVGLRFPLYPLFVAPTLFYLLRGLRTRQRNDFILSGLFLGLGLHGYSPIRILPVVVVVAIGLYLLHAQSKGARKQAVAWLAILALVSFFVFLPLARYWLDNPEAFSYRAFSRLGTVEAPLPAPAWQIFLSNTWNALRMFNWDDGEIWVHSVTHRPALDVVSAALFLIGVVLVLVRYIRQRHWQDLFLLLSVPLLLLPSILSLAFPGENPALNRAGGALVPVFLLVAIALDGLFESLWRRMRPRPAAVLTGLLAVGLVAGSAYQNYDLVFRQYANQFKGGAWNSSQMGAVIKPFGITYGTTDSVWIVPYPYWVDTRLPGVWAGIPNRDFAIWPEQFASTVDIPGPKLFLLKSEDEANLAALQALYPNSVLSTFHSGMEGKDFLMLFVPADH
jgi:hypothetical protein